MVFEDVFIIKIGPDANMTTKNFFFAALLTLALILQLSAGYAEAAKPDLQVISASTIPESPAVGQEFQVEYAIANNGIGVFNGALRVFVKIENKAETYLFEGTILPGESKTQAYVWPSTFERAGSYNMTVTLESGIPAGWINPSSDGFEPDQHEPGASVAETSPKDTNPEKKITKVIVITEYESGDIETQVYQGGSDYGAASGPSNNMLLTALAAVGCIILLGFYFIRIRAPSTDAELEKLQKEKEEIERVLELAKINYYKRRIDEESYKKITVENQQRLMQIEARMSSIEKRVDKIERKLE